MHKAMTDSEVAQIESRVSTILAGVDRSWSEFEKALYIHDYIVVNTSYPETELENGTLDQVPHAFDIYGCLINGVCVCEGYSRTFMYLMNRLGIRCVVVSSESMNHMWNMVCINGSWYHVDCTWDDPVMNSQGRCLHSYFLKSDEEMMTNLKHDGWELKYRCSSIMYDYSWINDVNSAVVFRGDDRFYSVYSGGRIQVIQNMCGIENLFLNLDAVYVPTDNNYYYIYPVYISCYGDSLYYYDAQNIYEYNLANWEINVVYTLGDYNDKILELYVSPWGEARIRSNNMSAASYEVIDIGITTSDPIVTPTPITPTPDVSEYSVEVIGHSVILDGLVGVNFGMQLSSDVVNDPDAYVSFTWGNGNSANVMVSDLGYINGMYSVVCYVNAKEMTDIISARVIVSDKWESDSFTYSVAQYAEEFELFSQNSNQSFDMEKRLVQALLTYGSYAQEYFEYNTGNVPLSFENRCDLSIVDTVGFDRYVAYSSVQGNEVKFVGARLTLLSDSSMRLYFTLPSYISGYNVDVVYDGTRYLLTSEGSYWYIDINGMTADDLVDFYTLYIYVDGTLDSEITYSPMVYIYNVISHSDSYPQSLVDLVKAMYIYGATFDGYLG